MYNSDIVVNLQYYRAVATTRVPQKNLSWYLVFNISHKITSIIKLIGWQWKRNYGLLESLENVTKKSSFLTDSEIADHVKVNSGVKSDSSVISRHFTRLYCSQVFTFTQLLHTCNNYYTRTSSSSRSSSSTVNIHTQTVNLVGIQKKNLHAP